MAYDIGDRVRVETWVRNTNGSPANASSVILTITLPDQTTTTPSVANPPSETGHYVVDYVPTQAGRHVVRWVATTPNHADADVIDVMPASPGFIVSLADTKRHLRIKNDDNDDQLRTFIAATTEVIERHLDQALPIRTFEEEVPGGHAIALRKRPVVAVTSIDAVLSGSLSYDPDDVSINRADGILTLTGRSDFVGPLLVTYTAGKPVIPANETKAAEMIIQHLWITQRGSAVSSARFAGGDSDESSFLTGMGFSIPHRALELLGPQIGGFA